MSDVCFVYADAVSTIPIHWSAEFAACCYWGGLECTTSGYLIASCMATNSLYSIHIGSGEIIRLAGAASSGTSDGSALDAARFYAPGGLLLASDERSVFICDLNSSAVRALTVHL